MKLKRLTALLTAALMLQSTAAQNLTLANEMLLEDSTLVEDGVNEDEFAEDALIDDAVGSNEVIDDTGDDTIDETSEENDLILDDGEGYYTSDLISGLDSEPAGLDAIMAASATSVDSEYVGTGGIVEEGSCGTNLYYRVWGDNTLVIYGSGPMKTYTESSRAPWIKYNQQITKVIFEGSCTSICADAFWAFRALKEITIPDSVQTIGNGAFRYCTNLTKITLPFIGKSRNLSEKEEENVLGYIFGAEYRRSSGITPYTNQIPGRDSSGNTWYFYITTNLHEVVVTDQQYLYNYSFRNCSMLTSITLPKNLRWIYNSPFDNCTNLKTVNYPGTECDWSKVGAADPYDTDFLNDITVTGGSGHSFTNYVSNNDGDCLVQGTKTAVCDNGCGATDTVADETKNHQFGEYIPDNNATCTEDGTKTATCEICGEKTSIPDEGTAKGHSYENAGVVATTDTEDGYTRFVCTECGDEQREYLHGYGYVKAEGVYPESNHHYENNLDKSYTFTDPGATKLKVTFSSDTRVEINYDFLYIYDGSGNLIQKSTGSALADQTVEVDGDTVRIRITSDASQTHYGFKVTNIESYNILHNYAVTENVPSTCTEHGHITYACDICGKTKTETLELLPHTEVIDPAVESTCTEHGLTEGKHCSVCGTVLVRQTSTGLKAHTRVVDTPAVNATCTEAGHTEGAHCSVCGKVLETSVSLAPTGHKEVTDAAVEPTCTEDGLTEGTHCSVCGETTKAQEVIPATGHKTVADEAVEATCTETGLTEGSHCSVCGETLVAQEVVEATGHTEVEDPQVDPTCTESGLTAGSHCAVCGEILVAQLTIEATGHTEEIDVEALAPTCLEEGHTKASHCSVCGEILSTEEVLEATGHTEEIDEAVEPTCTETGLTEGSHCSVCGEVLTEQEEIEATGHIWGEWTTTKKQTSFEDGEEERECSVCGEKETNVLPKYDDGLFDDVRDPSAYYFAPVYWAVENGITTGYKEDNTFRPEDTCTRGQMVMFLWRAAGKPAPRTTENPFVDVSPSDYYYKAVLWAVEMNITKGYSEDNTFRPNDDCQREHAATFLWRLAGQPTPKTTVNPFTDLSESDYYYKAVLWASENKIAKGYSEDSTYRPKDACMREHIVTFLYRSRSFLGQTPYEVSFRKNGSNATGSMISQRSYSPVVTLSAETFDRPGYVFKGWSTSAAGPVQYKNKAKVDIRTLAAKGSKQVTLYAIWVKTYKIVFKANLAPVDGAVSGSMNAVTAEYGQNVKLPKGQFTCDGWYFYGWTTKKDGSGTTYANGGTVKNLTSTAGGTVYLYGKWGPGPATITKLAKNSYKSNTVYVTSEGCDGYEIYRSTSATTGFVLSGTNTSAGSYDDGLTPKKVYYYKVRGYKADANGKKHYGKMSAVKSIRTAARPMINAYVNNTTGKYWNNCYVYVSNLGSLPITVDGTYNTYIGIVIPYTGASRTTGTLSSSSPTTIQPNIHARLVFNLDQQRYFSDGAHCFFQFWYDDCYYNIMVYNDDVPYIVPVYD